MVFQRVVRATVLVGRKDTIRTVKTHSGAKKRWILTEDGKSFKRKHAGAQHLNRDTSSSTRARQRQWEEANTIQKRVLKRLLPFK